MPRGRVMEGRSVSAHAGAAARSVRELHDVRHPRHPELRVDRVRVCPSGVHVITAPASADCAASQDEVVALARTAGLVVAQLLPPRYRDRVRPVVCRTDGAEVADLVDDVLVTSTATLDHILRSSPVVLSTSEVRDVGLRLGACLEPFPRATAPGPGRPAWRRALLAVAAAAVAGVVGVSALGQGLGVLPGPW